MKNIRKIVAILAAVLMFCSVLPMSAFAANGDVALDANFDSGMDGFQSDVSLSVEGGYLTFDAPGASWVTAYAYCNNIKANTYYEVTFSAKANKDAKLGFKINNGWSGEVFKEFVDVTTEWQDYTITMSDLALTDQALVMFLSDYDASVAPIFYIDNVKIVEAVDPALIGKVVNGDFSDNSGWTLGNGASIANGMLTLQNIGAWSEAAMQTVPVKANTNYEITWKSQCVSGSGVTYMTLMDSTFANLQVTSGQIWMTDTSGNWINHTVTLNTGDHESIIFKLTSEDGGTKTINIDDVKIIEVKDPSYDGYIYNGDFETGKCNFGQGQVATLGAWYNLWGSTSHELVAGYNSDYALKGTASGNYNITYQNVAVEPNTDYVVTAWSKDSANSALWIKNAGGNGDLKTANFNSDSDWGLTVVGFNSGSNSTVWVGLMGISAGGTYTVDNVKMFKAASVSNDDYLSNTNFEGGSLSSWQKIWDTQVAASIIDDGCDSAFAAKVTGLAPWGQLRQKVTVEPNTDYKVTLWAKDVNNMALLIKDGGDAGNISNTGINAGAEWTEISVEFNSGAYDSVYVGVMVNEAGSYGTFDNFLMEKVEPECEHEYFYPCDPVCMKCYEITNPDAAHNVLHVEAKDATCTENGNVEYWYCEYCGSAWLDADCTIVTNQRNVIIPAAHTYDDDCDSDCNVCEEWRDAPHNLTTHVEAMVPANCQEEGYNEHWICEDCGGYFMSNGMGGYYETNPAWMYYTGEHVRPEGAAGCAVVACELCGEDSYGTDPCVRPEGSFVCQNDTCVNCGGEIYGEGCTYGYDEDGNPLIPFCQPGDCIHCGTHYDYLYEHENGSYAPCSVDGECAFGCGLQFPATGVHAIDNPCEGGLCWMCWEEIPAADHVYDDDYDADCNVCGAIREVEAEVMYGDANGDGEINLRDVAVLQQYTSNWEVTLDLAAADANGDGEVNLRDVALLQQYTSNWEVTLGPVETPEENPLYNDGELGGW